MAAPRIVVVVLVVVVVVIVVVVVAVGGADRVLDVAFSCPFYMGVHLHLRYFTGLELEQGPA